MGFDMLWISAAALGAALYSLTRIREDGESFYLLLGASFQIFIGVVVTALDWFQERKKEKFIV